MQWNKRRNSTNMFLWGMLAGAVGSIYFSKWMGNQSNHRDEDKKSDTNGFPLNHVDKSTKDELFETFLKGNHDELQETAKDLNLSN